jgi:hypothetical protein
MAQVERDEGVVMTEQIETGSKKRGMAKASLYLIDAMVPIVRALQPITGRGVGYQLFTRKLTGSMGDMPRVYRLLRIAREHGYIPWSWIVDETRDEERRPSWSDPEEFARCAVNSYRRDFWDQQPHRVKVWSEKGTVRGILKPVLDRFGVGFQVKHGFDSATKVHDAVEDDDGRPLIVLYVGDFDPSGMFMSECDLPQRLANYGADHISLQRIALVPEQTSGLPSFPAKRKDPRYRWFIQNHGNRSWEIDAMDPRDLRHCVEREIRKLIEPVAWARCETVNAAEAESLRTILSKWKG